mmetsp:Transcript_23965/g.60980  ORF Transcript_23965/g.60980 Transcript_23965/m.60980 type:complete len:323 (+) Transcript_23965:77-1045(+)
MGTAFGRFSRTAPDRDLANTCQGLGADDVYNLLQDFRADALVLDVRPTAAYAAAHINGARHLGVLGSRSVAAQRVAGLVDAAFGHIRGPVRFTAVLCTDDGDAPAVRAAAAALAAAHWAATSATVASVAWTTFGDFRCLFPFASSGDSVSCATAAEAETDASDADAGRAEERLFPSVVSVAPRVYISSWALASDPHVFAALGPTHVVNCTPDHPHVFEGQAAYCRVPVVDSADQDLLVHLDAAVAFIAGAAAAGGVVLCHCRHGQSRSASVLAAWLVASRGWTPSQAVEHLQRCRPKVSPNAGFLQQLDTWARQRAAGRHQG